MSAGTVAETCRLVVRGPDRSIDLSVPVDVVVGDLLPALLTNLGTDLADRGLEHGGWVLQRIGEQPVAEDRTVAELDLLDGETLYLRARADQIPPMDFDDLVDGIATGVRGRSGLWLRRMSDAVGLGLAGLLLVGASITLLPLGPLAMGAASAGLLVAAALVHRLRDARPARLLAVIAVLDALAAFVLVARWPRVGAGDLLPASMALLGALLVVVLAALVAAPRSALEPVGLACASIAVLGAAAAGVVLSGGTWAAAAVPVLAATLLVRPLVPLLAFKLAGMRLPQLPTGAADLQEGIEPEPSRVVLEQTARVDRLMTALYLAIGLPALVAVVLLAGQDARAAQALACAVSLTLLLASRATTSLWHRLLAAAPATAAVLVLAFTLPVIPWARAAAAVAMAVAAALSVLAGYRFSVRAPTPLWGRLGDIVQLLSGLAIIPLGLQVMGAYDAIRARVG
ncbi:type VII secretion integral membrane protein EccD [Angustibacter sp. McL0619]|uniref:type VII secretion integral membrane protein EccD n=1 Tax=Angustibacter sp. McL0619 TaxID=3415676 RepID=UPI003CF818BE